MRWLALSVPIRFFLFGVGAVFVFAPKDYPDWMPRSEEYAIQWRDKLETVPTPEAAAANPEISVRQFPSGEWAFGVCRDGRGFQDGGAIVVKDSTGRVRTFLGPLGIPTTLADTLRDINSLAQFYHHESWNIFQYQEVHLP
jgi:hypothetical protein